MTAPTIVLLHGVGLDHHMWAPLVGHLGDRATVITPDLLGHGANPPAPVGITLRDLADGVLTHLPAGSHLVGFSLGALVAQHIARFHPDLIASVTSVSSVCKRTPAEREAVLGRLRVAEQDFDASADASVHRWFDGTDVPEDIVTDTDRVLRATDHQSFLNCYRVFATGDAEIGPELQHIAMPALAVTGELDPGSTPEMTHRLAQSIPGCREIVVDDARHMLPVQRPAELANHLITFIGEYAHV